MAFPQIKGSPASAGASAGAASRSPTLPSHAAGDLIFVRISIGVNSIATGDRIDETGGSGWTAVGPSQLHLSGWYLGRSFWKIAASSSETIETKFWDESASGYASDNGYSYVAYVFTGASSVDTGTQSSAESGGTSNDPPAHTVSGSGDFVGAKDYTWITVGSNSNTLTSAPTQPSGYTNLAWANGVGSGSSSTAGATVESNATSENPGLWTSVTTALNLLETTAIAPTGASAVMPPLLAPRTVAPFAISY